MSPWTVFWLFAAVGFIVILAHQRECGELGAAVARERSRLFAGAGLIGLLFCGYETAETAVTFTWLAPAAALETRCEQIDDDMLLKTVQSSGFDLKQSDVDASDECHRRLQAMAGIGVEILTHGHEQ